MFYIFAEGSSGNWIFMAHCRSPVIAHGFSEQGYTVSHCIDLTKFIAERLKLVK